MTDSDQQQHPTLLCSYAADYYEFSVFKTDCLKRLADPTKFLACKTCETGVLVASGQLTSLPVAADQQQLSAEISAEIQEILEESSLLNGPATRRWKLLSADIIPNLRSLSFLQPFWRRPGIASRSSAICPNCLRYRAYRGYGLCSSCVEALGDFSGQELLHELVLVSMLMTTEAAADSYTTPEDQHIPGIIYDLPETSTPWFYVPDDFLPALTLRHLRAFWKEPLIQETSTCPNCGSHGRPNPNGVCVSCAIAGAKKRGFSLLRALRARSR